MASGLVGLRSGVACLARAIPLLESSFGRCIHPVEAASGSRSSLVSSGSVSGAGPGTVTMPPPRESTSTAANSLEGQLKVH